MLETPRDPQARTRRLAWLGLAGTVALAIFVWLTFRFYPEKKATERFLDAVVAGDMNHAYELWKPGHSYTMQDFLADWGPRGYYGPVKSYHIMNTSSPRGASGVIVRVQVSPFSPVPAAEDLEKSRLTKVVSVWVESRDKSFSFPP